MGSSGTAGRISTCPCCASTDWQPAIDTGSFRYVACGSCDTHRLDPLPTEADAAELYGDDYFDAAANGGYPDYTADERLHRRNARSRLHRLGPPRRSDAVLVDVGCAHGFTMLEARSRGWSPHGVDVNATARASISARGMPAVGALQQLDLAPETAEAVTFFQSLEHMVDPLDALRRAHALLAPDGRLMIETWNRQSLIARLAGRRWQQVSPPSVVWLFGRDDLERLLQRAGFTTTAYRKTSKWVSLGMVTGQMEHRGNRIVGRIRTRLGALLRKVALPYALGDLVTVSAEPVKSAARRDEDNTMNRGTS